MQNIFLYSRESPLIFTQFYFWIFFAVVLFGYTFLSNKRIGRSAFLLLVSIFFYYKSSGFFFFLIIFSTFVGFYTGKGIGRNQNVFIRKLLLSISIVVNLGVLAYFKYAYFFTDAYNEFFSTNYEVINWLAKWSNDVWGSHFEVSKILLPVGISFFTFQTISYTIDVYRGLLKPVKNILDFGFYVSFFPQLVAGPIVRASHFIPQIYEKYSLSKEEFGLAVFIVLKGLIKKIFIGDYIAVNFVDRIFSEPITYTGFENLMAIIGYSLQVYVDFSGYTDIAIGVALLMGFRLPDNFNSPYKALSVGEFWQRWHISLSSWLKDYLYFPLGGNRRASIGTYLGLLAILSVIVLLSKNLMLIPIFLGSFLFLFLLAYLIPFVRLHIESNINRMITMLLGGLWHGASWNFIFWGGLNGLGIVVYKFWRLSVLNRLIFLGLFNTTLVILYIVNVLQPHLFTVLMFIVNIFWLVAFISTYFQRKLGDEKHRKWYLASPKILLTFSFITFTRVFFRNETFEKSRDMLHQITHAFDTSVIWDVIVGYKYVFLMMLFAFVTHWLSYKFKETWRNRFIRSPIWVKILIVVITVFIVYQSISAEMQPFIYFQF